MKDWHPDDWIMFGMGALAIVAGAAGIVGLVT